MHIWLSLAVAHGAELDLSVARGPGGLELTATGLTPGGPAAVVHGRTQRAGTLSGGPCAGTEVGVADFAVKLATADAYGVLSLTVAAPPSLDRAIQVVDGTSCGISNVACTRDGDGDGLCDRTEVIETGTDPTVPDTDGDAVGDGAEVLVTGTDPLADERECAGLSSHAIGTIGREGGDLCMPHVTDVDLDGHVDVIGCATPDEVPIFYGDGAGGFTRVGLPFADTVSMLLGAEDLTGDGTIDLMVQGWTQVYVYEGMGGRTFTGPTGIGVRPGCERVNGPIKPVLADVDGDFDFDVLCPQWNGGYVVHYESTPGGYDVKATYPSGGTPQRIERVDIDADGDEDFIVVDTYYYAATLTLLKNDGVGNLTMSAIVTLPAQYNEFRAVDIGDLDNDGYADVAYLDDAGPWVVRGSSTGVFSAPVSVAALPVSRGLALSDFDQDGRLDVLVHDNDDTLRVLRNEMPAFVQIASFPMPDPLLGHAGAAIDLNGDGHDDLLVDQANAWLENRVYRYGTDDDGDGLDFEVEVCISDTDPGTFDTDGGGVGDGDELDNLTDPRDATDE